MNTISITKLYELLSAKVGREIAESLTSYIKEKIEEEVESKAQTLATKEDLAREIANTKAELIREIANTKAETIRWMFIFWVSQVFATFGFILLFLKK